MKKRILATVMVVVVLIASLGITATATTKSKVGTKSGKWSYDCSVLKGTYYSKYNDDTSWLHWEHSISYVYGSQDHGSWVQNNKTGAYSGRVYAACGKYSNATVKASWTGSGTAGWFLK
jgi:hypothetical protein